MSFCTDCGKFCYQSDDHYCAHCGSRIEQTEGGRFTERQIEAFNDPIVTLELCNTEEGRWMLNDATNYGLIKDSKIIKLLLEL
jgi:hypothetical protein